MKILSKKNKNGKGSPLNASKLDYSFILTICFVTTFLILIFAHPNSLTSPDECFYLHLGKCIVDGSDYYFGFPDGRPVIPSIIAFFLYLGLDIVAVRLLIPLIFMNLALISTYALGKTLFGRKEAVIATLFLFTFPFFWYLGTAMYVDIPLTTFTTLFLLFFYLGIEKDIKFLPISAIFISVALLTKMNAVLILLAALFYLIVRRKWDICIKKEFIISAMIIPLSLLSIYTIFHVFMSAKTGFSFIGAANVPFQSLEILQLGFAPILFLTIFGISKERRSIYLLLPILTFFVFWAITGRFFALRHFIPLLPVVGILIAIGFFKLLNKYNKKIICILLILLLAVSFVHAVYLNDHCDKASQWGITMLSASVNELEGNGKVAIDHFTAGYYLRASTDKDIIDAFKIEEYTHVRTYDIITDEWIQKNNIDYIILSVYGELPRTKSIDYFHPKFLMIEVPFIEVFCYGRLPQSHFQFKSDIYNMCEKNYERVDEICKDNQKVFIIYKVK